MLRSMNELQGFQLHASDGDIGRLVECLFDDSKWTARYLLLDTGGWTRHQVLISPISVIHIDAVDRIVTVALTTRQIHDSPAPELYRPVSRQYERDYMNYYGYAPYWVGTDSWGSGRSPADLARSRVSASGRGADSGGGEPGWDSHLRSSRDVKGHHIQATDGEIGHVDDFLFDDQTWAIQYLRVDTSNWIGGRAVLVPRRALRDISWPEKKIYVELSRDEVANSPTYDPARLNREYEEQLDERSGAPVH